MEHLFKSIITWLNIHPGWVGIAGCCFTFYESLAIVGLTSPGSLTMFALGLLVGSGTVPAIDIFIWTAIGAIAGDSLSYWLGYRYHHNIRNLWPISRFPKLIDKGKNFFNKYGGVGLFIGRFLAVRSIIPLVAGIMRFSPRKFLLADILSGILWPPVYMLPGILLGAASIHFAPEEALHVILILFIIVIIIWLLIWLSKLLTRLLNTHWMNLCAKLWLKLKARNSLVYVLLYEHEQPAVARPLSIAFFTLVGIVLFLIIFINIWLNTAWLQSINLSVLNLFASLHTTFLEHIAIAISIYFGKVNVIFATAIFIAVYFIIKRDWHALAHFIALLVLSAVGIEAGKLLTHHLRPQLTINPPQTYSFPSGHTLLSFILFGFIAFLIAHNNKIWCKKLSYSIATFIVCIVMLSRLYLNVHWFFDIIGSLLLGGCILSIIIIAYRRKERCNCYHPLSLLAILILGQIVFGSWYYHKHAKILQRDFQLIQTQHHIDKNQWWNSKYSLLPIYRHNRFGKPTQVLNLQWRGDLQNIKKSLLQKGWQQPSYFGLHALKQKLSGKKVTVLSPLAAQVQFHNPVLILVKPLQQTKGYLILHLWDINYRTNKQPLFLGNISYHLLEGKHWLWHHKKLCTHIYSAAIKKLKADLHIWKFKGINFQQRYTLNTHRCVEKNHIILLIDKN